MYGGDSSDFPTKRIHQIVIPYQNSDVVQIKRNKYQYGANNVRMARSTANVSVSPRQCMLQQSITVHSTTKSINTQTTRIQYNKSLTLFIFY